jgi:hypothetical protein
MSFELQHVLAFRHCWPCWQQFGPHTLVGVQQPPPGSTPPIWQHWPPIGSHCSWLEQQVSTDEEPHTLVLGQHWPLTHCVPDGLQRQECAETGSSVRTSTNCCIMKLKVCQTSGDHAMDLCLLLCCI